ncbi:MAG TPA: hypothetical protein VM328_10135 [Fimbriimonadaceae bacterium]|nr:hypothetical protein [Fimbriimonadaceae bacterium]
MSSNLESRLGTMIIAGLAMIGGGAVLTVMLYGAAAARLAQSQGKDPTLLVTAVIGPLIIILGILLTGTGVFYGLYRNKKLATTKDVRSEPGCQILARFAMLPGSDEMLFSESDYDPDWEGVRYFARLATSDGRSIELECPIEVFRACGEGMRGTAMIQGSWLGGFQRTAIGAESYNRSNG